ncbi:MAG TPA: hypothetical protein VLT84_09450 [Acidobacteriota bacterium]|nr:hypothetical protein [Acidobacteriota bacterium]
MFGRGAAIVVFIALSLPRAAASEPIHFGVGYDYQGGPSSARWHGPTAFAFTASPRGDASLAATRYHDSARGPGFSGATRAGLSVAGTALARLFASYSASDAGWNGWNVQAGPEINAGGTAFHLGYQRSGDRDGARGEFVVLSAGRALGPAFYGEAGLAYGSSHDDTGVRATLGSAWSRGALQLFAQGALGNVDAVTGSAAGTGTSTGRSGRMRTDRDLTGEADLASSLVAGIRYTIR